MCFNKKNNNDTSHTYALRFHTAIIGKVVFCAYCEYMCIYAKKQNKKEREMKLKCILLNKVLLLFIIGIVRGYPGEQYLHPTIHFAPTYVSDKGG